MSQNIILTTGIYDAIKDKVRRRKVTLQEEQILTEQLKNAKQVLRKNLPEDVVTVNRVVTIKHHDTGETRDYIFVASNKSKVSKNKYSILSDIALATVGCSVGSVIKWPFKEGEKTLEVIAVKPFVQQN
jgi:regulator of nucleoside diphosphate kinase